MPLLQFKGKSFVQNHHLAVPYHQLVPQKEKSLTGNVSLHDNLVIHGDNLLALKALLPTYGGKVDCIYIDPPYNTGNERWVYSDNVKSPIIKEWIGHVVGKEGEDLTRHDKWLCMLMPRLKLLKELLAENGLLLVSIDENESHKLRILLDEIFGETNSIGEFIWKNKHGGGGDSPHLVKEHEHILVYAKNITKLPELFVTPPPEYEKMFRYKDKRGRYYLDRLDKKGIATDRPNLIYEIEMPDGTMKSAAPTPWRLSPSELERRRANDEIEFKKDPQGDWQVYTKTYLTDGSGTERRVKARSVLKQEIVGFTQDGNKELEAIFGKRIFENPKPSKLIKYLLDYATHDIKDAVILDSFGGSGTTAQAVLELNKEDGGDRKFILVELENHADTITAERVRRVVKGVPSAKNELVKTGLGGTFSFFEVGDPIETEGILSGKNLPSYQELARYVYYTATGEEFDESKLSEAHQFVGSSSHYDVYMFYKPDIEYLKQTALTLNMARALREKAGTRPLLVFAPTKYVETGELDELKVDFCQLPFEIYKVK